MLVWFLESLQILYVLMAELYLTNLVCLCQYQFQNLIQESENLGSVTELFFSIIDDI